MNNHLISGNFIIKHQGTKKYDKKQMKDETKSIWTYDI